MLETVVMSRQGLYSLLFKFVLQHAQVRASYILGAQYRLVRML
jgi:hypothetical protein